MYRFLIILLILAISVWVGVKIATNPGYALFTWHHAALEMPLWLLFLILVIGFILIYFFTKLIVYLIGLPNHWRNNLAYRRQQKLAALDDQHLFAMVYQKPQNWHNILQALPQLEKKPWLSSQQIKSLQKESYEGLLNEYKTNLDYTALDSTWNNMPPSLKKDPKLLNLYIQALINHHEDEKAELLLFKQLKKSWFGPLVLTYSFIKSANPSRQLALAEKWLQKHPNDPYLLLSLGRLCRQRKLWGKARDYLEKSLLYCPAHPETYLELGELFEDLAEPLHALEWFKKGLNKKVMAAFSNHNNDLSIAS